MPEIEQLRYRCDQHIGRIMELIDPPQTLPDRLFQSLGLRTELENNLKALEWSLAYLRDAEREALKKMRGEHVWKSGSSSSSA